MLVVAGCAANTYRRARTPRWLPACRRNAGRPLRCGLGRCPRRRGPCGASAVFAQRVPTASELLSDFADYDGEEYDAVGYSDDAYDAVDGDEYTDEELLNDGLSWKAVQLFREAADEFGMLTFKAMTSISEIADMLEEGDLEVLELRAMWDRLEQKYGEIDVKQFDKLWADIQDLFESDDAMDDEKGFLVEPGEVPVEAREAVERAMATDSWWVDFRDGLLRPARYIAAGVPNPMRDLGECANPRCGLTRVGGSKVREEFLRFSVREIARCAELIPDRGLIYCTLGPGCLYFDWELLTQLRAEGVRVAEVWIMDSLVSQKQNTLRAQYAFASWFAGFGIDVHVLPTPSAMKEWVANRKSVGQADVVMNCDSFLTLGLFFDNKFRETILRIGGVGLALCKKGKSAIRRLGIQEDVGVFKFSTEKRDVSGKWEDANKLDWKEEVPE